MTELQDIGDKWAKQISTEFETWAEDVKLNGRSNTPIVRFDPSPLIESAMLEAGEAQIGELGKLLGTGLKFDLKSPEAIKWAKEYAAEQVKYIDAGTKSGIRQVTLRGLQDGLSPREQSKAIRSMVGLLPRHVVAVQNYKENLLSSGMDASTVDKLAGKYASKLLRYRADTIGLTESHTSTNEGARQVNQDAIKRGIIAEDEYLQEWLTAADKSRCDKCGGMQGKTAKVNGDFSGDGRGPPLHPRCRCTTILVRNPDFKTKTGLTVAQMETVNKYRDKIQSDHIEVRNDLDAMFGKDHEIQARVKKPDSIAEKLARKPEKYKGDPANLQDISGLRVVTKSSADQEAVVQKFKSKYGDKILKGTEDDFYKKPQSPDPGYRAFHATIEKNGMPHEVQIKTKNMETWSECNHPLYKNDAWTKDAGKDPDVQAYMRKAADVYQQRDLGQKAELPSTPQKLKDLPGWDEITKKFGWE